MATSKSIKANRTTLVDGCGTILKDNRFRGGYQLVKRKRVKSDTPTATAPTNVVTATAIPAHSFGVILLDQSNSSN